MALFVLSGLCAAAFGFLISFGHANRSLLGGLIMRAAWRILPDDLFPADGDARPRIPMGDQGQSLHFGKREWLWLVIGLFSGKIFDAIFWVLANRYEDLCWLSP